MNRKVTNMLNEVLVNIFNNMMTIEEKAIITKEFKDITNNDFHVLEAVGIEEPRSVSNIAKRLSVTAGTLNVAMNSLEKKGYIVRERSQKDKRVVLATLTEKGRKAFFHHRDFHKRMIHAIVHGLGDDEVCALHKCLSRLMNFFEENAQKNS